MYQANYLLKFKPLQPINKFDLWRKIAKSKNLSVKTQLRLEWIIFYYTAGKENAQATCRHFGLARSKFYFWLRRFNDRNLKSLQGRPPIAKTTRKWHPDPLILARMLKLRRKYIHWGKMKLAKLYYDTHSEKISSWQFQKVISEFKLYPARKKNSYKDNGVKKQLISYQLRNTAKNLFSIDTKVLQIFGIKYYIIMAVAHTGKLAYGRAYKTHSSAAAADFLARLIYLLAAKPNIILTDNGSEFQKHFEQACRKRQVKRYYSRVRTPKDNPEVERLIKTFIYEWLNDGKWSPNLHQFNKHITDWLIEYNSVRPHQKLNYLTPLAYSQKNGLLSKRVSSTNSGI